MKKIILVLVLGVVASAGLLGCSSKAQPTTTSTTSPKTTTTSSAPAPTTTAAKAQITLKLAHAYMESSLTGIQAAKLQELMTKYTNGRVQMQMFPASTLYNETQVLQGVATGGADMALAADWVFQGTIPDYLISYLNFWWDGYDQSKAFLTAKEGGLKMLSKLEPAGLKGLAIAPNSYNAVFVTKDKQVKSMYDLKDMKVRGVGGLTAVRDAFVGASPVSLPQMDVRTAFDQGLINVQAAAADGVIAEKWYEAAKYAFNTHDVAATRTLFINLKTWNGLPADIQTAITTQVVPDWLAWNWQYVPGFEADILSQIGKKMTLSNQTEQERATLRDAMWTNEQPFWSKIDPDLLKFAQSLRTSK